jgi:hypothetical protein
MKSIAVVAATILATQPCLAADDFRDASRMERRSGAFAGATLKVMMANSPRKAPAAHFGLGVSQFHEWTGSAGAAKRMQTPGVELRLSSTGKPLLMVGGQNSASMKQRLGLASSTGTILLVVGGIAAAVLAVSLLSDDDDDRSCPFAPPC